MTDTLNRITQIDLLDAAIRLHHPELRAKRTNAGAILESYEAAMGDASSRENEDLSGELAKVDRITSPTNSTSTLIQEISYIIERDAEFKMGEFSDDGEAEVDVSNAKHLAATILNVVVKHGIINKPSEIPVLNENSLETALKAYCHISDHGMANKEALSTAIGVYLNATRDKVTPQSVYDIMLDFLDKHIADNDHDIAASALRWIDEKYRAATKQEAQPQEIPVKRVSNEHELTNLLAESICKRVNAAGYCYAASQWYGTALEALRLIQDSLNEPKREIGNQKCEACSGRGEVGGFCHNESNPGYETHECVECYGTGERNPAVGILKDILYHDERGQGSGYSEAMDKAKKLINSIEGGS